jgi:hypothetical protein
MPTIDFESAAIFGLRVYVGLPYGKQAMYLNPTYGSYLVIILKNADSENISDY